MPMQFSAMAQMAGSVSAPEIREKGREGVSFFWARVDGMDFLDRIGAYMLRLGETGGIIPSRGRCCRRRR